MLKSNLQETWASLARPCVHRRTWWSFTGWTCKPVSFCLWQIKEPSLKQTDQSCWIMNEVIFTLSYLISLPTMLKAVCNIWYFVLLPKPRLLLYHCSEESFREFWIALMIWFTPRVTPQHKDPIVLPGYPSVVKEILLLAVFWTVYCVSNMMNKRRILNKVHSLEMKPAWYPSCIMQTCLYIRHH